MMLFPDDDVWRTAGSVLLLEGAVPVLAGLCFLMLCTIPRPSDAVLPTEA